MTLHQEAGTLSRRCRRSDASLPLLELGLASPASLAYNRTHSSAVRESSQYAPNLPHACSPHSMRWTLMHSKRLYFLTTCIQNTYLAFLHTFIFYERSPSSSLLVLSKLIFHLLKKEEIKVEGTQAISRTAHEAWPRLQRYPFEFTQPLGDFLIRPYNSTPCSHRPSPEHVDVPPAGLKPMRHLGP